MERITIWKSSLEGVLRDLSRANLVCSDVGGWITRLADKTADDDPAGDKLYGISRVLSLLEENLDNTFDYLSEWVRNPCKHFEQPVRTVTSAPPIPEDIDLSHFDDIPYEELLQEARRQEAIIAAAEIEKAIIVAAMTRRVSSPTRQNEDVEKRAA